jgi:hypothetical protein
MAGTTAIKNGLPLSSDQGESLTKNRQNPGGVARRQGRTAGEELADPAFQRKSQPSERRPGNAWIPGVAGTILATRRVTPQEGAATAFNPWTALVVGWKGEA